MTLKNDFKAHIGGGGGVAQPEPQLQLNLGAGEGGGNQAITFLAFKIIIIQTEFSASPWQSPRATGCKRPTFSRQSAGKH
jgi:hypothetical protein